MNNTKPSILLHHLIIILLVTITCLTWSLNAQIILKIIASVSLVIYIIVLMLYYHIKLQKAFQAVSQYGADDITQKRMLHLQKVMLELSNDMTKMNGLDELLDVILKKAIEVMPEAEFGSVLIMNADGLLEFKAIYGFEEDLFQVKLNPKESYQWLVTGGSFSGPLIIKNLSQFSKDFMNDSTFSTMAELDALSPKSSLSAPLLIDGEFFGSINIDSIDNNAFTDDHKKLMAYFANQVTIAIKNHQYYEKMLFLSKYDGLTGIMNRHYFQETIEILLQENIREREPITFVLMDLNHFKNINDQYGHASGDYILTSFTRLFSAQLRQTDLFARYGGDEFIAVFFNSDKASTTHKLLSIYEMITNEAITLNNNQKIHCSFSFGLAEFPAESTELKTLIHIADQRMYQYKNMMKNY